MNGSFSIHFKINKSACAGRVSYIPGKNTETHLTRFIVRLFVVCVFEIQAINEVNNYFTEKIKRALFIFHNFSKIYTGFYVIII